MTDPSDPIDGRDPLGMRSDRGTTANPIEFVEPAEPVGAPADGLPRPAARFSALSLSGMRTRWIAVSLTLAGGIAVVVAQFLDQVTISFPAPDESGDSVLQRVEFGVDGFGRIHVSGRSVAFPYGGHSPRLGVPALVAAAVLLLGVGYLVVRGSPLTRPARSIAWLLAGLVAGCLTSASLFDVNDESWSFDAGWWLYAAGTACLLAACFAMAAPDAPQREPIE